MYIGVATALAMAALVLWPVRVLLQVCLLGILVCVGGALAALMGMVRERIVDSKYDLRALEKLHEQEELKRIQLEEPTDYDSVHCLNCGQVYNIRMPVCPNCGAPPGHAGHHG